MAEVPDTGDIHFAWESKEYGNFWRNVVEETPEGKLEVRVTQVTQLFGEITIPPDAARFEMDVEFNDGVRVKLEAREK